MDFEKQLLIIDDNMDLCHNLKDIFEDKGYQVSMAHTGADGLAGLQHHDYHVALLDIRLPDVQGPDLLPDILQMHPDIQVIIITAYGSMETAIQAVNLGAYAYVIKPLDMDEVLVTVERAVERLRLVQQERHLIERLQQELADRQYAEIEREQLITELRKALDRVKTLSGILPICSNCKKIRDDQDYWHDVTAYIRDHSEVDFTHGICPDCMKELYSDYVDDDE